MGHRDGALPASEWSVSNRLRGLSKKTCSAFGHLKKTTFRLLFLCRYLGGTTMAWNVNARTGRGPVVLGLFTMLPWPLSLLWVSCTPILYYV